MADRIFMADGPSGPLYAAAGPVSEYIQGRVADYRLTAVLAPYRSDDDAKAALVAAGGENVREWTK